MHYVLYIGVDGNRSFGIIGVAVNKIKPNQLERTSWIVPAIAKLKFVRYYDIIAALLNDCVNTSYHIII